MPQMRSKYEMYKESSLSQQLAHKMPEYQEYAGSDPDTSLALANLHVLEKFGIIDPKNKGVELMKALLNERRKALFATSERVNEITKMGLQMPQREEVYDGSDNDETDTDDKGLHKEGLR